MSPSERMRCYPAVGPAIPRRRTGCSRVTHPSATEPGLPPVPYDLHVLGTPPAFVLSQDQTLQLLKNPNSSSERLAFSYVVRITSESNPRDARLIARRSNGSALHTLDHQFSKSRAQKVPAQTPMLTGRPDPSQGASALAHTSPPRGDFTEPSTAPHVARLPHSPRTPRCPRRMRQASNKIGRAHV